jgi:hypothetical protein
MIDKNPDRNSFLHMKISFHKTLSINKHSVSACFQVKENYPAK